MTRHIVEGEYRVRFCVEIVTELGGNPREAFEAEYGGRGDEKMIAMLIREGADVEEVHVSPHDGGHDDSCTSCGHEVDLADSDTCMSCQVDDVACPGCRCMPGDDVTADCWHPTGCGFNKKVIEEKVIEARLMAGKTTTVTELLNKRQAENFRRTPESVSERTLTQADVGESFGCRCPIADLLSNGHRAGCPDKK